MVKTGLTEYEAFMCESALINIFRLEGLSFPSTTILTNKVNGHANTFEKYAEIETAALSVEEYYELYCKNPILVDVLVDAMDLEKNPELADVIDKEDRELRLKLVEEMDPEQREDFQDRNIIFININGIYSECTDNKKFPDKDEQTQAIREGVRAFWPITPEDKNKDAEYVFAMVNGRIKGVFKIVKDDNNTFSYSILDMWRDNYPSFFKLTGRKKEYETIRAIYNDLISQGILIEHIPADKQLKKYKKTLYSQLNDVTKKLFKESLIDTSEYENWLTKKKEKDSEFQDNYNSRTLYYNELYKAWEKDNQKKWDKYYNKKKTKKPEFDCSEVSFLNNVLWNQIDKKYFVLTELSQCDPDYTKYINCSVRFSPEYIPVFQAVKNYKNKEKRTPFDQFPARYLKSILKDIRDNRKKYKKNLSNE